MKKQNLIFLISIFLSSSIFANHSHQLQSTLDNDEFLKDAQFSVLAVTFISPISLKPKSVDDPQATILVDEVLRGNEKVGDKLQIRFKSFGLDPHKEFIQSGHKSVILTPEDLVQGDHVIVAAKPGSIYDVNESPIYSDTSVNRFQIDQHMDHPSLGRKMLPNAFRIFVGVLLIGIVLKFRLIPDSLRLKIISTLPLFLSKRLS